MTASSCYSDCQICLLLIVDLTCSPSANLPANYDTSYAGGFIADMVGYL